jgi:hypothetical protein
MCNEVSTVYVDNHMKHTYTLCGQTAFLSVEVVCLVIIAL